MKNMCNSTDKNALYIYSFSVCTSKWQVEFVSGQPNEVGLHAQHMIRIVHNWFIRTCR